eukprot:202452-Pelagomonas_calceolata.AAC.2
MKVPCPFCAICVQAYPYLIVSSWYLCTRSAKQLRKSRSLNQRALISGYHYQRWQKLNDAIPPTTTANTEAHNPISQHANKEIRYFFWQNLGITLN